MPAYRFGLLFDGLQCCVAVSYEVADGQHAASAGRLPATNHSSIIRLNQPGQV